MDDLEKRYYWVIMDAIMNQAIKDGAFVCCGFSVEAEAKALVSAALDCEMHGSSIRKQLADN